MSAPTAATTYRRPQQAAAFWSVTQSQWDIWVDDAAHAPTPAQRKAASQNLRKFDAAGRIMETFEGIDAVSACSWYVRNFRRRTVSMVEVFADKIKKSSNNIYLTVGARGQAR